MGKQTLILEEDWYSEEVVLIALHTVSELYKVAYWVNSALGIRLQRRRRFIDVWRKGTHFSFPLYDYEDGVHDLKFYLVGNKIEYQAEEKTPNELLFENNSTYFESFIPERREVDAFLKIEGSEEAMDWLPMLRNVKVLSAVYAVDIKILKSYNNLIFE